MLISIYFSRSLPSAFGLRNWSISLDHSTAIPPIFAFQIVKFPYLAQSLLLLPCHVTRCIVKYFSYRKKLWISDRYVEEFGLKFRKREYYCHIFVYRFLNSDIWAPKIHISLILKSS